MLNFIDAVLGCLFWALLVITALVAVVTLTLRAVSSVGRAPDLHSGGQRFDPVTVHTDFFA